tara:strand:- start:332 stop:574 length:243 start_codon:yes stop_codon:yes gene_type:complete
MRWSSGSAISLATAETPLAALCVFIFYLDGHEVAERLFPSFTIFNIKAHSRFSPGFRGCERQAFEKEALFPIGKCLHKVA